MLVYVLSYLVTSEKLPGQKTYDEEDEEGREFLGIFDIF